MEIKKLVAVPLGIAGASLGLGIIGNALSPSSVAEKITDAGTAGAGYIAPAVHISMGGVIIKQLKDLKKIRR